MTQRTLRYRLLIVTFASVVVLRFAVAARADIYQWEFINRADPSQGKRQSMTLAPDGAGVDAVPGVNLSDRNLSRSYLRGAVFYSIGRPRVGDTPIAITSDFSRANLTDADLTRAILPTANLSQANLGGADLTSANLNFAALAGASLAGAEIRATGLVSTTDRGFTAAQLYSTASYRAGDLSGIGLGTNDLTGWNFAGQNLEKASFEFASLTGANFTGANVERTDFYVTTDNGFSAPQLYSTASYQARNLQGIQLGGNDLRDWNFVGQNLTNASFFSATLTDAEFTGAEIRGANFDTFVGALGDVRGTGITLAQLYSTASYQAHDLRGIHVDGNQFAGGNFAGQNLEYALLAHASLQGANLSHANLTNTYFPGYFLFTGADLTGADTRGAYIAANSELVLFGATTTNLINSDGRIHGLNLDSGRLLVVRDYDRSIPITIDEHLVTAPGGTLQIVFEADAWDSTISFAPGIPVALGGTLELDFANEVNLASQVGRTFDLFDWSGVAPTGTFAVSSRYAWDLSNLYTTGDVTLAALPESPNIAIAVAGALGLTFFRRRIR